MALIRDAIAFFELSEHYAAKSAPGTIELSERYARASIVAAFAGLEAQFNAAGFSHATAHEASLEPVVRDVLCEQETFVDDKGFLGRRPKYLPLKTRIAFLALFLAGKAFDRSTQVWANLDRAIELRDMCVHPKPPFPLDTFTPTAARSVISTVISVMVEMHRLMGLPPLPYWRDVDELREGAHVFDV